MGIWGFLFTDVRAAPSIAFVLFLLPIDPTRRYMIPVLLLLFVLVSHRHKLDSFFVAFVGLFYLILLGKLKIQSRIIC
jgi:hypothetical protein